MKYLIVALGNPGSEYQETRHNIGTLFLDALAQIGEAKSFALNKSLGSAVTQSRLQIRGKESPVVLAKPETFVNTSGPLVAKLKKHLELKPENIIVVQDDLDIPFGKVKLSFDKNSGGHRGVESVIASLKTKKFWRLRLGTQTNALKKAYALPEKKKNEFVRSFVLAKFSKSEKEQLQDIFKEALARLAQK